jgi:hypothetical protein
MSRSTALRIQAGYAIEAQQRAQEKKERGELRWLADDYDCPDVMRLAALMEELGEVAQCVHDGSPPDLLAHELAQLAGVALAWGAALQQLSLLAEAEA